MIPAWLDSLNAFAWIAANLLVGYISIIVVAFGITYYVLFDPRATTAGKRIFRFFVSLIGLIGLIFIGLFIDPRIGREWNVYPGDVILWRPVVRLIVYSYVAYTVTDLVVLLAIRKWWPHKLRTARDVDLLKVRTLR